MNFFQAQEHARKQTRWLILLFVLAVCSLILITTLCVAIFVWFTTREDLSTVPTGVWPFLQHIAQILGIYKLLWIAAIICASVGLASYFRWQDLRQGGRVVAESLGGRLIATNIRELKQRQLLNVVEEMALAASMPVPPVYLLAHESGINAFAAGVDLEDAVIGVTQGCLDTLNREQLQGVIAHEFSHILNGDMRMNQKLVAILSGLMMISTIGRWLFELASDSSYRHSRNRGSAGLFFGLLGLCLMVIGWLGQFFGALIRSAVSRQREFLADASAVQFTRNADGIGGALQVIGGYTRQSRVVHHRAHELGHFFFSAAYERSLADLFATHPPLDERIRRVLPAWDSEYLQPDKDITEPRPSYDNASTRLNEDGSIDFVPAGTRPVATAFNPTLPKPPAQTTLSTHPTVRDLDFAWLQNKAHEPDSACLMILALLLHQDATLRQQQIAFLRDLSSDDMSALTQMMRPLFTRNHDDYLTVLELCIPALKELSTHQYQRLREQMSLLIHADSQVDLFEWALFEIVRQYCDVHFGLRKPASAHYKTLASIQPHFVCVLTKLVGLGASEAESQQRAFDAGCRSAGLPRQPVPLNEQNSPSHFTHAARELAKAWPLLKPRLLKGFIHAAQRDGIIRSEERQLITAISVMMDCPLVGLSME